MAALEMFLVLLVSCVSQSLAFNGPCLVEKLKPGEGFIKVDEKECEHGSCTEESLLYKEERGPFYRVTYCADGKPIECANNLVSCDEETQCPRRKPCLTDYRFKYGESTSSKKSFCAGRDRIPVEIDFSHC